MSSQSSYEIDSNNDALCEVKIGWLQAFSDAVIFGSFSRAARYRNIHEHGIRKPVKQLEEWLGVRLLLRQGGRLTLTPDGHEFLPKAHLIIEVLMGFQNRISFDRLCDLKQTSMETIFMVGRKKSGGEDFEID